MGMTQSIAVKFQSLIWNINIQGEDESIFIPMNIFFYSRKNAFLKPEMSFDFITHPPFCQKSKIFNTLRLRCS